MFFMYIVFAFAALHTLFVNGQLGPLPVDVGLQGSFFSPQTLSVAVNNSVTFEFFGDVHSVTQSSFADPCAPLSGGFHSGFLGLGPNNSGAVQVWNLVITDVSNPIWYFCAVTKPVFHCTVGMVGAINPPSQAEFASFSLAAKAVTTTPSINPTPVLVGIGAFASSTPTVSALSVTPTPTPTSSSSLPTSTPTSTSTSSPSPTATTALSTTSNLGAIVGGTVGGGIALIGFIVLLWYLCMRNKQAPATVQDDDFFRYNPVTARRPNEVFTDTVGSGTLNHMPSTMSNTNTSSHVTNPTTRLTPLRRPSAPVILEPPYLHRQTSQQSDLASTSSNPTTSGRNFSEPSNNVDIRALAQEVAAVLYQNPSKDYVQDPRGQMLVQNHDEPDYANSSQMTHQPPPNYRAATGPSIGPSSSIGSPRKTPYS